jgi:hypothetical protein
MKHAASDFISDFIEVALKLNEGYRSAEHLSNFAKILDFVPPMRSSSFKRATQFFACLKNRPVRGEIF